jgi:hypothetical protein
MRSKVLSLAVFLCGVLLFSSCVQKMPEKIEWAFSLDDALETAPEQNKHIIAEFWSEG